MEIRNVLILGSGGMLGYAVFEYFKRKHYNCIAIDKQEFDISKDSMSKLIPFLENMDIVVNCAGVIKSHINKLTVEDVLRINSIFPRNLAKFCKSNKILCFHITTDCVYTGQKGKYSESDFFDATDVYGMSKNAGEPTECMTIRTSIIGEERANYMSLLEWARSNKGKEVNGFLNHYWNGVTTLYFAEIIENILEKGLYQEGIFHLHSQNVVNKYELLRIFDRTYKLNLEINPIETPILCDRSLTSIYNLSTQVCTKDIEQQVIEMREFFLST